MELSQILGTYNLPQIWFDVRLHIRLDNQLDIDKFKKIIISLSNILDLEISLYLETADLQVIKQIIIYIGRMIKYVNATDLTHLPLFLKTCNITELSFYKSTIESIGEFAHKIEKLGISGYPLDSLDLTFARLISLNICNAKLSKEQIKILIDGSPLLQNLLANNTDIDHTMITNQITTLHIQNCNFDPQYIPNIKELNISGINFNADNLYPTLTNIKILYTDQFSTHLPKSCNKLYFNSIIEFNNIFWILDNIDLNHLEFKSTGLFLNKFSRLELERLVDNRIVLEAHDRLSLRDAIIKMEFPIEKVLSWKYSTREIHCLYLVKLKIKLNIYMEIDDTSIIIDPIFYLPYDVKLTIHQKYNPDLFLKTIDLHSYIDLDWKSIHIYHITIEGVNLSDIPQCLELKLINCIFDDSLSKKINCLPKVHLINPSGYTFLGFLYLSNHNIPLPKYYGMSKLTKDQLLALIPILYSRRDATMALIEALNLLEPTGIIKPIILEAALSVEHQIVQFLLPKFDIFLSDYIEVKDSPLDLIPMIKKFYRMPVLLYATEVPQIDWIPDYLIITGTPKIWDIKAHTLELRKTILNKDNLSYIVKNIKHLVLNCTSITLSDLSDLDLPIPVKTIETQIGDIGKVKNICKLLTLTTLPKDCYQYIKITRENVIDLALLANKDTKILEPIFQWISQYSSGEIKLELNQGYLLTLTSQFPKGLDIFMVIWETIKDLITQLSIKFFYNDYWCFLIDHISTSKVVGLDIFVTQKIKSFPLNNYSNLKTLGLHGYCFPLDINTNITYLETDTIEHVNFFPNLKSLSLTGFGKLHLKTLCLDSLQITGYNLDTERIELSKLLLYGVELGRFNFIGLTQLTLCNMKLPNLEKIITSNNITYLDLTASTFPITAILKAKKLHCLILSMCTWIKDNDLIALLDLGLDFLDLSNCTGITYKTVYNFLHKGVNLGLKNIFPDNLQKLDICDDQWAMIYHKLFPEIVNLTISGNLSPEKFYLINFKSLNSLKLKNTNLQNKDNFKFVAGVSKLTFIGSEFTKDHLQIIQGTKYLKLKNCTISCDLELGLKIKIINCDINLLSILKMDIDLDAKTKVQLNNLRKTLGLNNF